MQVAKQVPATKVRWRTSALLRTVEYCLKSFAIILLLLLVRRAWIAVDILNYDSLAYHLPFAARLVGIIPPSKFLFVDHMEPLYQGFPLLAELLQGLLWRLFGRMQAANLVGLGSLVLFCLFARVYLQVPAYLMFISLLAIPLVQIHATASLVDLPTNVACAIMLLLIYLFLAGTAAPSWPNVTVFAIATGALANMKFLHLPLVGLAGLIVGGLLVHRYRSGGMRARRCAVNAILVLVIGTPLIFTTVFKNVVLFRNPVYPFAAQASVGSIGDSVLFPTYLKGVPQSIRWLVSLAEYRAFDARRPILWMGEQGYLPNGVPADRMGGYFFAFVIMNLLLFGFLVWRLRSREARVAGAFFLVMSVITSLLPQSHELRYYMYWMIVLVSLNWYLLVRAWKKSVLGLAPEYVGVACCVVLLIVVRLTHGAYLQPTTQPMVDGYIQAIKPSIREAVAKDPNICVSGGYNLFLLYADEFHPPLKYSVKAAYIDQQCQGRLIVRYR